MLSYFRSRLSHFWGNKQQQEAPVGGPKLPYRSLDLMFNHNNVWLNIQDPNPSKIWFDVWNFVSSGLRLRFRGLRLIGSGCMPRSLVKYFCTFSRLPVLWFVLKL